MKFLSIIGCIVLAGCSPTEKTIKTECHRWAPKQDITALEVALIVPNIHAFGGNMDIRFKPEEWSALPLEWKRHFGECGL